MVDALGTWDAPFMATPTQKELVIADMVYGELTLIGAVFEIDADVLPALNTYKFEFKLKNEFLVENVPLLGVIIVSITPVV